MNDVVCTRCHGRNFITLCRVCDAEAIKRAFHPNDLLFKELEEGKDKVSLLEIVRQIRNGRDIRHYYLTEEESLALLEKWISNEETICEDCQFYEGCEYKFLHKNVNVKENEVVKLGSLSFGKENKELRCPLCGSGLTIEAVKDKAMHINPETAETRIYANCSNEVCGASYLVNMTLERALRNVEVEMRFKI